MIPVARVAEPPEFDAKARQPGRQWLLANPAPKRPHDFWSPFRHVLAQGFRNRCGYSAMLDMDGTVDHFVSVKQERELAYEWINYRYASHMINSRKGVRAVLDPHDVGEGWFEVLLPSLQLVLTDKVPVEVRPLAEITLQVLGISHDERILRQRRQWYAMYQSGKLSLDGLRDVAPLIAAAVEKQQTAMKVAG